MAYSNIEWADSCMDELTKTPEKLSVWIGKVFRKDDVLLGTPLVRCIVDLKKLDLSHLLQLTVYETVVPKQMIKFAWIIELTKNQLYDLHVLLIWLSFILFYEDIFK